MAGSIANLAVKLSLDSAGYESGIRLSEQSTRRWGTSLDSIIEKMEMQGQHVEESSRRAAIFAAAQKGANSQTVAYALALDKQLEAAERLAASEAQAAQAEKIRRASIQQIVDGLREEYMTYGLTNTEIQVYKLQQMGASDATIQAARSLANKLELMKQNDSANKITAASNVLVASTERDSLQATMAASAAMTKKMMIVQSLAYGVEDAATVYGTSGLTGAVRASANNIVMAAMLINPKIGIYAALGSAAIQLGAAFMKSGSDAKTAADMYQAYEDRIKAIDQVLQNAISRQNQLRGLDSSGSAENAIRSIEEEMNAKKSVLRTAVAEQQALQDDLSGQKTWEDFFNWEGNLSTADHKILNRSGKGIQDRIDELREMEKFLPRLEEARKRLLEEERVNLEMDLSITAGELRLEQQRREEEQLSSLAEQYRKLAGGPMAEYNQKLLDLIETFDRGKITESEFRVNMRKLDEEFLKPSAAAQKYIENAMTPLEKYEKELDKLQEALAMGDITEAVYDKNAELLQGQIFKEDKSIRNAAGGAALKGSAAAFETIAAVITADMTKDSAQATAKNTAQLLTEAKKQTVALEEVRKKLEPIQEASL